MNRIRRIIIKIFLLICLLFFSTFSKTLIAQEKKENLSFFNGNYLFILPGFYYTIYDAQILPDREYTAFGGAFEHVSRINLRHEFVIGVSNQWNQPRNSAAKSSLTGYYLSWRYHIAPLTIIPYYSLFFEFSSGIYDLISDELTGRFRTGGFSIGLGNRFSFSGNLALQLSFQLRNIQFYLPGYPERTDIAPSAEQKPTQKLDSIIVYFGMGYRYIDWQN